MTQLAIKKITMHHENRNYTNVYMCVQGSELYVGKVASVDPTHPYEYYPLGDTPIATNGTVLTIQLWNYDPQQLIKQVQFGEQKLLNYKGKPIVTNDAWSFMVEFEITGRPYMVNTMMYQSTNNPHNAVKQIKQQPQRLPSSEMEPKPSSRLYNFRELAKPTSALNFSPSLLQLNLIDKYGGRSHGGSKYVPNRQEEQYMQLTQAKSVSQLRKLELLSKKDDKMKIPEEEGKVYEKNLPNYTMGAK